MRPQINKENNDKKYDERYQINIIDDKESYERYHISKNGEEKVTEDIEFLKLQKLSSQKKNHPGKESDEISQMDMSYDNKYN